MKTLQLQRKVLNGIGKKNPDNYHYSKIEENKRVALTDGFVLWSIDEDDLLINLDRLKESNLTQFLDVNPGDLQLLEVKEYFRKPGDKEEYVRLQGKDVGKVYIKSKYLEFFENYELVGTGSKKPVYVAEEGRTGATGVIMPIVMKGEDYD